VAMETHGRWPLVGAVGLLPVTALAVRGPGGHLQRSYGIRPRSGVSTGSFLPTINQEVFGSGDVPLRSLMR
jgi:hypothetical protein